jgi:3',5'-cyclic AMP phosphodiesterase CpdA
MGSALRGGATLANGHSVSAVAPIPVATEPSRPDLVRLVHLTDLHYGFGFNRELWANMASIIKGLRPHIIVVTGDLVNSPWWWRLVAVDKELKGLQQQTGNPAGSPPYLFVIPGNHDTRLYGILPIVWITPILLGVMAIAVAGVLIGLWRSGFLALLGVAIGALALRLLCLRKFVHYFRDLIPPCPHYLRELGLVLYPFDSATYATTAACGKIQARDFVNAAKSVAPGSVAIYRIAMVHHHVLPIPYDGKHETMMVLKNAGAFLSEAARRDIRLVLNGHKHHDHFSRVTINADGEQERESCRCCRRARRPPAGGPVDMDSISTSSKSTDRRARR